MSYQIQSRQIHSCRSEFEPSYYSRPSRGVSSMSSFGRRFVPGATLSPSHSAEILSFSRSMNESKATGLQSEQDQRSEIGNASTGEMA